MIVVKLIEFLRNRLKTVIRICIGILGLLMLVDALLVSKKDAHTGIEHIPAFWSVFGFVACAVIVILSKWYGHAGIMQREDYYERNQSEEERKS
jgi:hypothetical protein